ncbi:Protein of unknown function [Pyronema omphalodes CBS 100304]|uniref:Uncharacterized protein n=1 Tax=Pyronema omphalodes (strain CBS 100304) TaxID=1076935 RepID=U4L2X8_PYROM|nr:Protein of unknown function [Pyronema omphalodes CBS 100304]
MLFGKSASSAVIYLLANLPIPTPVFGRPLVFLPVQSKIPTSTFPKRGPNSKPLSSLSRSLGSCLSTTKDEITPWHQKSRTLAMDATTTSTQQVDGSVPSYQWQSEHWMKPVSWRQLVSMALASSGPRRTQNIDCCDLFNVVRFQERFSENLERRWKAALEVSKKEKEVLRRVVRLRTDERIDKGGLLHPP